jgi:hypothetical protein
VVNSDKVGFFVICFPTGTLSMIDILRVVRHDTNVFANGIVFTNGLRGTVLMDVLSKSSVSQIYANGNLFASGLRGAVLI